MSSVSTDLKEAAHPGRQPRALPRTGPIRWVEPERPSRERLQPSVVFTMSRVRLGAGATSSFPFLWQLATMDVSKKERARTVGFLCCVPLGRSWPLSGLLPVFSLDQSLPLLRLCGASMEVMLGSLPV